MRSRLRRLAGPALGALLGLLTLTPAGAQTAGAARLQGRIVNTQGEGLSGVTVTLSDPRGGQVPRTTTTDPEGRYALSKLKAGDGYVLKASLPGYGSVIAEGVALEAGRTTVLNLTLRAASESEETVRVEARGAIVDTSSGTTAAGYDAEVIEALPLLGRRFTDILTLAPGVDDTDGDGNPNVRGSRDTGLQLRLDGTNVTDPLTGHIGQGINIEAVQEVQIITGGAPAEYGQTEGGFASVITKSGGNELEGSAKVFFRSKFLDGDGANGGRTSAPQFSDTDGFVTIGGPIRRDRLWYFGTVERLDEEKPVAFSNRSFGLQTLEGWKAFAKLTWQVNTSHKLAFQVNHDPIETLGNNIGPEIEPESDYMVRIGGPLPQISWTAIISPTLLLQTIVSHQDGSLEIDPVSDGLRVMEVEKVVQSNGQFSVKLPCVIRNCAGEPGLRRFFRPDAAAALSGRPGPLHEAGPYNVKTDQAVQRTTVRTDLSYTIEDRLGQHAIKSGFEHNVEHYAEENVNDPILTDRTCEFSTCGFTRTGTPPPPGTRFGTLFLEVTDPVVKQQTADAYRIGAYLQDAWKLRPNLTLNAGLRFDHEEIDTEGFTSFEPAREAREVLRRYDLVCDAAGSICTGSRTPGLRDGDMPNPVTPPPGHPALRFDLDGDGSLDLSGPEWALITAPFTTREQRVPDTFFIPNSNVSPRFSLSWDPAGSGKTRLFASWGTYYDRLFLGAVTRDQNPASFTAEWFVNGVGKQAEPASLSSLSSGVISISQTDRDIATPYVNEWTAGIERELAPEWAVSLTWINRRGRRLLQDLDVNHITCKGFDTTFHVDPMDVCGDGGFLELDRFGKIVITPTGNPFNAPNGAPDLYALNENFNQVLRVGNYNSSKYTAAELVLRKRLHRNWQMLMSYTHARAFGDAESFTGLQGNDPAVSDKQRGYLDYDRRHVFKWEAVSHLPHGMLLGGTIQWASGLPYSFVSNVEDLDDHGNLTPQRVFSITGRRNDQRNSPQLTVNGHLEKRLLVGKTALSAFLDAENLLNSNDLQLKVVDRDAREALNGTRRFGRRWQIGVAVFF